MAVIPSIKGSIFQRGIEDLRKLVSEGKVSREGLESALEPADLVYLDAPIQLSAWYDVQTYGRILELLKRIVGDGDIEYLRRRGAESAKALLKAGLYQQMEYLYRTRVASAEGAKERFVAFGRDLKLLVSFHRTILNFGEQTSRVDPEHPDRYLLEITGAGAYPEALVWTTDGFINRMAKQHDHHDLWIWTRPEPDLLRFRMTRPA